MDEVLQEILVAEGFDGWEVVDDCVLRSPNGWLVEYDGTSSDGEVSPLIVLGMI